MSEQSTATSEKIKLPGQQNLMENLNEAQLQAVTHREGPLMIVAGAGTGKTTVVTQRIAYLVEQGLAKPENILALTFTEKAAGEMEERVDMLLPMGYVDLQISTFHSFCETLLRDWGVEIGLSRNFKMLTEIDSWLLARQNFDRFELNYYRPLGNPTKYIRSLLTHFSRLKDEAISPEAYLAFVEGKRADVDTATSSEEVTTELDRLLELANAYHTYQQIILEHDALDFGDLLMYAINLLQERPNVLAQIREQFTHVLVDEFQDTNVAQYMLVKLIASPRNNLTVVGDDDQSIYKFRGASLANILQFESDYPDAKRIVLTDNYRSVQAVLDHSYTFIQGNNPNRLEAQSGGSLVKQLVSHKEGSGVIEHLHSATLEEEAESVANKILALKDEHPDASWSDFAILTRSNDAATTFLASLERHGIPFQFLALRGLYTKPIILDMLALLRVIQNPFESASMYRILSHTKFALAPMTVAELSQLSNKMGKSLHEACELVRTLTHLPPEEMDKVDQILHSLRELRTDAAKKPVTELFLLTAKNLGMLEHINTLSEREKHDSFRFLQQFYDRLKAFEAREEHPILRTFLAEFAHERDAGEEGALEVDLDDAGPDMVKLMTIHASKGLEFRFVFVVNMVDQRFPTRMRKDAIPLPDGLTIKEDLGKDWHLEEERRLFYVAMTRAKEGLFLTSADDYGGARTRKLSKFLHELGYEKPASTPSNPQGFLNEQPITIIANDEITLPLPKQFSFTQLVAFKTCPLQYKFAHVYKIPVFGKWTFSFGKTMHNTLHAFFTEWMERERAPQGTLFDAPASADAMTFPVSLEELLKLYQEHWQDDWFVSDEQRETYREKGRASFVSYYSFLKEQPPNPLHLELGFTLKIGGVVVKGRFDRIDTFEDGIEIIDYKTGTPKDAKKMAKGDKEQLVLYQLAARDALGLNVKKLTFHYLEDHSQVSFLGSDDDLLDLQETIIDRVKGIKASQFSPTPGFHCQFCDFADICEYRAS